MSWIGHLSSLQFGQLVYGYMFCMHYISSDLVVMKFRHVVDTTLGSHTSKVTSKVSWIWYYGRYENEYGKPGIVYV